MFGEDYAAKSGNLDPAHAGTNGVGSAGTAGQGWRTGASAFNISDYWRLAVKYRLIILGALAASLVIGVVATLLMTPIYTASATLQIDREAARVLELDDVAPRESMIQGEEFFQTQYGLLRSRSLAERVVDDLGLANSNDFLTKVNATLPERANESVAVQVARRRELVLQIVRENLGVAPVRGSRLVAVSFDSPDPQLSATITNAFAKNFIQSNLDRKYESSAYARQFLEERIIQTKTKLEEAERGLVAYAANQQIINVQEAETPGGEPHSLEANNLVTLNAALAEAKSQRVAAEEKWRQAQSAASTSLTEVLQNPAIQRLTEERAKLDAEYQQKLSVYRPDWPEMLQTKARIDELNAQINAVAASIRSSIRGQYVIAANQERSLQGQVNGLKGDVLDLRERSVQYTILQREVDTSRALYDALLQRYKEVGVTGGVTSNNISVVDEATVPEKPSQPRMLLNLIMAGLLGLLLGGVAAFVLEALDETLATPDDVESKLGLPVLGVIPLLENGQSPALAMAEIRSSFSEAYYSLRTALQFSTPNGSPATLLVTSTRPAEGKSTTAYAIAVNLARIDKKVLLIDGDLRNPSMHRLMGVDNDVGMSNLLSGSADLGSIARPTAQPGLQFVPSGPLPPNPAELWSSDRLREILLRARAEYDHIVIDGPPVLGFADAPVLASAVEGTVFVLESRSTRRAQARGAIRRLSIGKAHLLGAVLTKFNTRTVQYGGYDYAYDYTYGGKDKDTSKKSKRRG